MNKNFISIDSVHIDGLTYEQGENTGQIVIKNEEGTVIQTLAVTYMAETLTKSVAITALDEVARYIHELFLTTVGTNGMQPNQDWGNFVGVLSEDRGTIVEAQYERLDREHAHPHIPPENFIKEKLNHVWVSLSPTLILREGDPDSNNKPQPTPEALNDKGEKVNGVLKNSSSKEVASKPGFLQRVAATINTLLNEIGTPFYGFMKQLRHKNKISPSLEEPGALLSTISKLSTKKSPSGGREAQNIPKQSGEEATQAGGLFRNEGFEQTRDDAFDPEVQEKERFDETISRDQEASDSNEVELVNRQEDLKHVNLSELEADIEIADEAEPESIRKWVDAPVSDRDWDQLFGDERALEQLKDELKAHINHSSVIGAGEHIIIKKAEARYPTFVSSSTPKDLLESRRLGVSLLERIIIEQLLESLTSGNSASKSHRPTKETTPPNNLPSRPGFSSNSLGEEESMAPVAMSDVPYTLHAAEEKQRNKSNPKSPPPIPVQGGRQRRLFKQINSLITQRKKKVAKSASPETPSISLLEVRKGIEELLRELFILDDPAFLADKSQLRGVVAYLLTKLQTRRVVALSDQEVLFLDRFLPYPDERTATRMRDLVKALAREMIVHGSSLTAEEAGAIAEIVHYYKSNYPLSSLNSSEKNIVRDLFYGMETEEARPARDVCISALDKTKEWTDDLWSAIPGAANWQRQFAQNLVKEILKRKIEERMQNLFPEV